MRTAKGGAIGMLLALAAQAVFAQATLPTVHTGPWQYGVPPAGWTFSGLGGPDYLPDYDGINDGAAKLDGTGDFIEIAFNEPASQLSFWIRGLTFAGGIFTVEESTNGVAWTALQTYADPPTNAAFQVLTPSPAARFVRFIYTSRGTGNVGIDGITLLKEDFVQPVISGATYGGTNSISVLETVLGRTYVLEYTRGLDAVPALWTPVDSDAGTGGGLVLQDLSPTNAARFYRVRDATP